MVYIIHFLEKLFHAQHYVGHINETETVKAPTTAFKRRMKEHRSGNGARILDVCNEKGINYIIARIMPGNKREERRIKDTNNTKRYCPICQEDKKK